jgi:hypothetical protein
MSDKLSRPNRKLSVRRIHINEEIYQIFRRLEQIRVYSQLKMFQQESLRRGRLSLRPPPTSSDPSFKASERSNPTLFHRDFFSISDRFFETISNSRLGCYFHFSSNFMEMDAFYQQIMQEPNFPLHFAPIRRSKVDLDIVELHSVGKPIYFPRYKSNIKICIDISDFSFRPSGPIHEMPNGCSI